MGNNMQEKDFQETLKIFKSYLIGSLLTLMISVSIALTAFYFNTNKDIEFLNKRVEVLESESVKSNILDVKLNNIMNNITDIKADIKEIKNGK